MPLASSPIALLAAATPPESQGGGRETLESLGRELQSLPLASAAPAAVLVGIGIALLIYGRHILRPAIVIAALVFGSTLGGTLLSLVVPGVGGLSLALLGAIVATTAAALAWRLLYGVATGLVGAFALALVALTAVQTGMVDARDVSAPPAAGAEETRLSEIADEEALLERTPEAIRPLVRWSKERWDTEQPQVRTLLLAAAAAGAFTGFALGLWLPSAAASALTSLTGSLFVLVGGFPLLASWSGRDSTGASPGGWLVAWIAIALGGWMVQSWRSRAKGAAD